MLYCYCTVTSAKGQRMQLTSFCQRNWLNGSIKGLSLAKMHICVRFSLFALMPCRTLCLIHESSYQMNRKSMKRLKFSTTQENISIDYIYISPTYRGNDIVATI
jgi:hypothetical protein